MAGGFKLTCKVSGIKELEKQLKELAKPSTWKKIQRQAATKAIRPMRKAVKADCPVDEGGLKKSIDSKVSIKNHGMSAIIGSNTATLEDGKKAQEKNEGPRAARHLHLVLFGHIGDDGAAVPGNNFLQKGYEASVSQCMAIYEANLKAGIEKAVSESKG